MKKNNLLLALLASSLILTSCGGDDTKTNESQSEDTTSQSGDSNATPGASSEEAPQTSVDNRTNLQKAADLFAELEAGKSSTITFTGNEKVEYYGNDKGAMFFDLSGQSTYDQGYAVVPNFGLYTVISTVVNQKTTYFLSEILTPNTALKIGDLIDTTKDLGAAAKTATWKESSRTHTISTEDTTFGDTLLSVLGYGPYAEYYGAKKTSFVVNEEGTSLLGMSLELGSPTEAGTAQNAPQTYKFEGLKISDIGTTYNLDLDVLISNPGIAARSAWTQEETDYFATMHASFTLPFPGTGSYAINTSATKTGGFMYEDLGCGNIVNAYKTKLTTAGFEADDATTNAAQGIFGYTKTLVAAQGNVGAIKEYVQFAWMNSTNTATVYPNGRFVLVASVIQEEVRITISELTTSLSSYTLDADGTAWWPSMTIEGCTGATLEDTTDAVNATSSYTTYDLALEGKLYFATEAEAIAAVNTINGQLGKNGYTDIYLSYYGCMSLEIDDSYGYYTETVDVYAQVAYDENGNYLGYVRLVIRKYYAESYDWYDDYDW